MKCLLNPNAQFSSLCIARFSVWKFCISPDGLFCFFSLIWFELRMYRGSVVLQWWLFCKWNKSGRTSDKKSSRDESQVYCSAHHHMIAFCMRKNVKWMLWIRCCFAFTGRLLHCDDIGDTAEESAGSRRFAWSEITSEAYLWRRRAKIIDFETPQESSTNTKKR